MFGQRCESCERAVFPQLDEDIYVERIASKVELMAGLRSPIRRVGNYDDEYKEGGEPHRADSCEACLAGINHV